MSSPGIEVAFSPEVPPSAATARATSILHEVATLLDRQLATGEPGSIDIGRVPLSSADQRLLEEVLQFGEVDAEIGDETARVRESAVPGVWWLDFFGAGSRTVARFIEVTEIPEILRSGVHDRQKGLLRLNRKLAELR
jgi:hydrogenase-1 operon protein HyaF